jgi:chromosome segregation ATPase
VLQDDSTARQSRRREKANETEADSEVSRPSKRRKIDVPVLSTNESGSDAIIPVGKKQSGKAKAGIPDMEDSQNKSSSDDKKTGNGETGNRDNEPSVRDHLIDLGEAVKQAKELLDRVQHLQEKLITKNQGIADLEQKILTLEEENASLQQQLAKAKTECQDFRDTLQAFKDLFENGHTQKANANET